MSTTQSEPKSQTQNAPKKFDEMTDEELEQEIVSTFEHYFSEENLKSDVYLRNLIQKDPKQCNYNNTHSPFSDVPISEIATFPKIKKMKKDLSFIKKAIRQSKVIKLDDSGDYIVRDQPLPPFEVWSTWSSTHS